MIVMIIMIVVAVLVLMFVLAVLFIVVKVFMVVLMVNVSPQIRRMRVAPRRRTRTFGRLGGEG